MRKWLCIVFCCATIAAQGQWRLGVNAGATYNHYSIDKHYMTDYRYDNQWAATAGVMTQYNFFPWLGLRVGVYFTQRNYRHTRAEYADRLNVKYVNNYLLFPVTVNFSFGSPTVRGFVNLGVYGGAWLSSYRSGKEYASVSDTPINFSETVTFNKQKDQRGDFGYTGGVGIEYRFHTHWLAQIEATCYYSIISSTKPYMDHVKDYRYNTTIGLQAGVAYIF